MPKRSRKPHGDENTAALDAVRALTNTSDPDEVRRRAAALLGSIGGKKGGPARAAKLSKRRLSEIGRKAARARWSTRVRPRKRGAR